MSSSVSGVPYGLSLFVFHLELPLHFKVGLTFTLYSLLFHVSNDTSVHSLNMVNILSEAESGVQKLRNRTYLFLNRLTIMNESNNTGRAYYGCQKS